MEKKTTNLNWWTPDFWTMKSRSQWENNHTVFCRSPILAFMILYYFTALAGPTVSILFCLIEFFRHFTPWVYPSFCCRSPPWVSSVCFSERFKFSIQSSRLNPLLKKKTGAFNGLRDVCLDFCWGGCSSLLECQKHLWDPKSGDFTCLEDGLRGHGDLCGKKKPWWSLGSAPRRSGCFAPLPNGCMAFLWQIKTGMILIFQNYNWNPGVESFDTWYFGLPGNQMVPSI